MRRHQPKPLIPIVLRHFAEDRVDLLGLKELFRLKNKSYEDCPSQQKNQFIAELFEDIENRLDRFFHPAPAEPRRRRLLEKDNEECGSITSDKARLLAARETEFFVESYAAPTSLSPEDFEAQALERLASQSQNALDFLEKWALDEKGPIFAAVLGEYGIGKTTTLKQLTHRLLDKREKIASTPLPIFIDLRFYSEKIRRHEVPELREFLEEIFQRDWQSPHPMTVNSEAVLRLVREEGAILIFDGLDEKLVHLDDAQARAFIRMLWSALPPQVFRSDSSRSSTAPPDGKRAGKLLFSCRSHYFKTIREQGAMLRGEDQCLLTLQGHANSVNACAWSPDGQRLLSGSGDNTLKVWDAHSGQCLLTLQGHANSVNACAWSPDGQRLLSGSGDNTLKVWDTHSGQCLLTLQCHASSVTACAWSPDGQRLLSGSLDGTFKVWDARSGEELMTLALGPRGQTAALDFRNRRILAASPEAWRFVAWRFLDPETQTLRLLPADHFAPLPSG